MCGQAGLQLCFFTLSSLCVRWQPLNKPPRKRTHNSSLFVLCRSKQSGLERQRNFRSVVLPCHGCRAQTAGHVIVFHSPARLTAHHAVKLIVLCLDVVGAGRVRLTKAVGLSVRHEGKENVKPATKPADGTRARGTASFDHGIPKRRVGFPLVRSNKLVKQREQRLSPRRNKLRLALGGEEGFGAGSQLLPVFERALERDGGETAACHDPKLKKRLANVHQSDARRNKIHRAGRRKRCVCHLHGPFDSFRRNLFTKLNGNPGPIVARGAENKLVAMHHEGFLAFKGDKVVPQFVAVGVDMLGNRLQHHEPHMIGAKRKRVMPIKRSQTCLDKAVGNVASNDREVLAVGHAFDPALGGQGTALLQCTGEIHGLLAIGRRSWR
eukprot:m.14084 g.14084  ORF g.14084 m.14084 type:complete len:381 (-) comp4726_c0_seq1:257-1399(-)